MKYSEAAKIYRAASGSKYQAPDKTASYLRNDVWHLVGESGGLIAVVHPDGSLNFGDSLRAVLEVAATRKRRA